MESQTLDLSPLATDCVELATSALERLAPAAEAKGVTLSPALPDSPVSCVCDPAHVQQVLLNLVGNAIKFSPRDGVVNIGLSIEGDSAVFRVTDAGPGIPEPQHDMIFLKYYRDPSVRDSVDGAGLGLAIARSIVEAHGGRMHLDSAPGHGSTFSFSLPLQGPEKTR
jgi:signal transduction histidine kinase